MTKYLPRETSKKLAELIGEYDTELCFSSGYTYPVLTSIAGVSYQAPAPDFGELILLLPRVLEAKGSLALGGTIDSEEYIAHRICFSYIDSNGDMEAVAKVLEEIIG